MNPRALTLISICVVVAALYLARDVLVPVALGTLLTFLLAPLVRRVEGWGLPRVPAVLLVVFLAFGIIAGIGYVIAGQAVELAQDLPSYRENIRHKIEWFRVDNKSVVSQVTETIHDLQKTPSSQPTTQTTTQPAMADSSGTDRWALLSPDGFSRAVASGLRQGPPIPVTLSSEESPWQFLLTNVSILLSPLATAGIVIVFVIFMLLEREDLRDRMIQLLGQGRLTVTTKALDDAASRISRYLVAQATVNGTYGICVALGLWIIGNTVGPQSGFPSFALWGLLCAILRFIPYVGPWLGAAFPLAVSVLMFDGFHVLLATSGLFVTAEIISNGLMEPWLYGSSTGMSTVAILASAVFWTWVWGPIGLMLATPLTVCLVVLGKHVPPLHFLDVLLGDEPVFKPPARVYQRLLAMDRAEVQSVINELLGQQTLEELYDNVLMPALAMGERDRHRNQLEPKQSEFILSTMRSVVEELGTKWRQKLAEDATTVKRLVRPTQNPMSIDSNVTVLCVPASDPADEISAMMLAQILEFLNFKPHVVSAGKLNTERAASIQKRQADLNVISSMPPSAAAHTRYLLKRLGPEIDTRKFLLGLWTIREPARRIGSRSSDQMKVARTIGEAVTQLYQMAALLVFTKATNTAPGTAPAT